jgi:hypothetical protein
VNTFIKIESLIGLIIIIGSYSSGPLSDFLKSRVHTIARSSKGWRRAGGSWRGSRRVRPCSKIKTICLWSPRTRRPKYEFVMFEPYSHRVYPSGPVPGHMRKKVLTGSVMSLFHLVRWLGPALFHMGKRSFIWPGDIVYRARWHKSSAIVTGKGRKKDTPRNLENTNYMHLWKGFPCGPAPNQVTGPVKTFFSYVARHRARWRKL